MHAVRTTNTHTRAHKHMHRSISFYINNDHWGMKLQAVEQYDQLLEFFSILHFYIHILQHRTLRKSVASICFVLFSVLFLNGILIIEFDNGDIN